MTKNLKFTSYSIFNFQLTAKLFVIALVFTSIFACKNNVVAQAVVFEEQVDTTPDPSSFGPNKKNFIHLFVGFGCIVGPAENAGSAIKYGISSDLEIAYRYKRKISNFYAWGTELGYHGSSFILKQDAQKTLPNSTINKNELFKFYNLALGIYNRFNFGRRGNAIGNYVDIGGNAEFPFSIVHIATNDGANGTVVKTLTSHLDYVNKLNYHAFIRFGSNRYALKAAYRFSDLFKSGNAYAELPRFAVTLQVGIHK